MIQIGYTYTLPVTERRQQDVILDAGELGNVSLASGEAGPVSVGDSIDVFIYTDARGQPMATTGKPLAQRNECASMRVVDITGAGAFLDWGLAKNLLLPFAEQRRPLEIGRYESVWVYLDNSGRLAASSRLDHHLSVVARNFTPWQAVSLLIYQRTDLGLKAVVDHRAIGLLYKDEVFKDVRIGQTVPGFIKSVRTDGRIDLALQPPSRQLQPELTEQIMAYLHTHDGTCPLSDKSPPEDIQSVFQVSKKNFKKALSSLYRERKIVIESDRIHLPDTD